MSAYLTLPSFILIAGWLAVAINESVPWVMRRVRDRVKPQVIPMEGQTELERCREALVKYMAIPWQRMVGSAQIAGSAELYPHTVDLCRVLDEQDIAHPEIDYRGLTILGAGEWARLLGDLWAVRHDVEAARVSKLVNCSERNHRHRCLSSNLPSASVLSFVLRPVPVRMLLCDPGTLRSV